MIHLKTYESFKLDEPKTMGELLENLSVVEQSILDSIKADPIDINTFFNERIPTEELDQLSNNSDFNNLLKVKGLSKSGVEHTDDYETFLLNPFKYLLIKDKNKSDLDNPDFIIIQTFNSTEQTWNNLKMYQIQGDFKNFYDKLTNRTIEIERDGTNYIYQTSNKNEWELVNQEEENDDFPRFIRKEELIELMK